MKYVLLLAWVWLALSPLAANAADLSPAQQRGRTFAEELRSEKPLENVATSGVFITRDTNGQRHRIPFRFHINTGATEWQSIYEVLANQRTVTERLTIVHADGQPNRYLWQRATGTTGLGEPIVLTGAQATLPFAGTDFWLSDLGLEFLYWPEQRVERDEMRHGTPCKVLESTNPNPAAGQYTRVESWIAMVEGRPSGLMRAKAYDRIHNLLKEFNFRKVKKVNGRWQLKELEISNIQADSTTLLEFDIEVKAERRSPPKA